MFLVVWVRVFERSTDHLSAGLSLSLSHGRIRVLIRVLLYEYIYIVTIIIIIKWISPNHGEYTALAVRPTILPSFAFSPFRQNKFGVLSDLDQWCLPKSDTVLV